MSEQPAVRRDPWRERMRHLGTYALRVTLFVLGAAAAFMALLVYNALAPAPPQLTTREVNDAIAKALASATPLPAFSADAYEIIQPSLVLVQTQSFGDGGESEQGLGSGVIINDNGDILTSLHVVTQATGIELVFADGTRSIAQVVATQPEHDIAVVRAARPATQLVPATLGNPNAMRVGDEVYAVGNPFGLHSSISSGVISGFDRSFRPQESEQRLEDLIQFDAAVNPGNSGGPLLNRYGEVIGIVTGLVNPSEQNFFVGVGFAVPITVAGRAAGAPPY